MSAGCYASIQNITSIWRESLCVDREIPDDGHEVCAHVPSNLTRLEFNQGGQVGGSVLPATNYDPANSMSRQRGLLIHRRRDLRPYPRSRGARPRLSWVRSSSARASGYRTHTVGTFRCDWATGLAHGSTGAEHGFDHRCPS